METRDRGGATAGLDGGVTSAGAISRGMEGIEGGRNEAGYPPEGGRRGDINRGDGDSRREAADQRGRANRGTRKNRANAKRTKRRSRRGRGGWNYSSVERMKTEAEKEISLLSGLREREEGEGRGRGLRRRRDKERGGEWREEKRSDFGKIRSNLCTRASILKYQSITFSAS